MSRFSGMKFFLREPLGSKEMNFDLTEEIVAMQDMVRKFGQRYET